VYVGEWKGGNQNGQGKFTFTDGSYYEGNWVQDKPEGDGTFTYPSGKIKSG